VITDYKGKKFLGLKAEKTLLGSILGEKLKNTLSCHNKGTYQRQIRAAGRQDLLRNRDLRKTNNLNNTHLVQPKAQDLFLSFEPGTDVQPVIEEKIMPIIEENKDFFM
jgi:hypothetical protein